MSFGNILGQVLQQGMGGRSRTPDRLRTGARSLEQSGGGLNDIFNRLQGSQGGVMQGRRSGTGSGGLEEMARDFLGKKQAQGLSGAQIGGIGAAVGALMGGGLGGAARGGALAVLGTLAIGALRGTGTGGDAAAQLRGGQGGSTTTPDISDAEVQELTSPETERLLLSTMISAANADGHVDAQEMRAILDKLDDSAVTDEERREVMSELRTPLSAEALAARVKGEAQAAQVYAAAVLATGDDTEAEKSYLRDLGAALRLDAGTIARLHQMTGVPAV